MNTLSLWVRDERISDGLISRRELIWITSGGFALDSRKIDVRLEDFVHVVRERVRRNVRDDLQEFAVIEAGRLQSFNFLFGDAAFCFCNPDSELHGGVGPSFGR